MVEQDKIPKEVTRPKGLFESLLGANALILYMDATEFPGKYDDRTSVLLHHMMMGKTFDKLTLEEQYLLDQATLDFASSGPKKTPSILTQTAKTKEIEQAPDEKIASEDNSPEANLKPYWWV